MDKLYLCIDLKTFYASVECVERNLDPFKTDLIVANPQRANGAICLAISPKMKERGIKNRCRVWEIPKNIKPIVAMPRMKKYIEYSAKIYKIYLKYFSKDDIHVYSIDEVFIDITNYLNLYKVDSKKLAGIVIDDIYNSTGITATAGIGTNLYLAKVALDILAKHDESHISYLDEKLYKEKLWEHEPLTDFWQVGHGISSRLKKYHVNNMCDITKIDSKKLYKEFGINAEYLIDHAYGIETCTINDIKNYKTSIKSLSNSQILYEDYTYDNAKIILNEMINYLTLQLIKKKLCTSTIGFAIGYSKNTISSTKFSKSLDNPTDRYKTISKILLEEYDYIVQKDFKIRRISVWYGNTSLKKYEQLNIFEDIKNIENENNLANAINDINDKYGKNSLLLGISYLDKATQRQRNTLIGGHNAE